MLITTIDEELSTVYDVTYDSALLLYKNQLKMSKRTSGREMIKDKTNRFLITTIIHFQLQSIWDKQIIILVRPAVRRTPESSAGGWSFIVALSYKS